MAKDKYILEDDVVESGNYNAAKIYSAMKIAHPLIEMDEYRRICMFGTSDMIDEFLIDEESRAKARLSALKRYIESCSMLIDNSWFAIKKKQDKDDLQEYGEALEQLKKLLPFAENKKTFQNSRGSSYSLEVNNSVYENIFNIAKKLSRNINKILNDSDLIFISIEDNDPEKIKNIYKKKMTEEG